jgi:hypothetical protein
MSKIKENPMVLYFLQPGLNEFEKKNMMAILLDS